MSRHNYSQYSANKRNANSNPAIIETTSIQPAPVVEPVLDPEVVPEVKMEVTNTKGVVVNCAKLNVREEPCIDADVVCVLNVMSEIEVNVAKSTDEWVYVCTAAGTEGYCMRKFVDVNL